MSPGIVIHTGETMAVLLKDILLLQIHLDAHVVLPDLKFNGHTLQWVSRI